MEEVRAKGAPSVVLVELAEVGVVAGSLPLLVTPLGGLAFGGTN